MSIIYDALRKTQKNRESNSIIQPPKTPAFMAPQKKNKHGIYLITALVIAVSFAFYFVTPHKEQIKIAKKTTSPASEKLNSPHGLTLDGLFVSDKNKVAMINHQMVRVGSVVNDMTVVAITAKSVKLKQGDEFFVLSPVV